MSKQPEHLRVVEGPLESAGPRVPQDPLVGHVVDGRYRFEGVLGEGGMGLVYKATHVVLNKPLAIKVLRPEVSRDEEIIQRFRQEAQSATAIGNRHIIDISDFGSLADGSTYFVMEYLDGHDLSRAMELEHPLKAGLAIHIAKQLTKALGAAHDAGIVHRDLKPDNVYLINRDGDPNFVKVLDFGIAKVGSNTARLTRAGQVFGTPHYMSPEQCAGSGVDRRTDIYALGVILYEMASARVPFEADNLMGILTKHMYEEPIPPRKLDPPVEVSPGLEAIILKCLEKRPELRYQTMAELYADLKKVEKGLTPEAVVDRVARTSRPPSGGLEVHTSSTTSDPVELPAQRSKRPLLLGGLGVVLVAAIGAAVALSGGEDEVASAVAQETAAASEETGSEDDVAGVEAEAEGEAVAKQEPPAEAVEVPVEEISIDTVPGGAEVWLGDELVGNAPVSIARPEDDQRVAITLRLAGYREKTVRVSSRASEQVRVTLVRARSARRSSSASPRQNSAPRNSEVLNPWGN